MKKKINNIILKIDKFFYRKFKSDKSTKVLENIKEAKKIFSYINVPGEEDKIKFVGGCVRKAMTGEFIDDIDLATSFEPKDIKLKLSNKDIKIIDTGIEHGTITAILNKKKFEITSLRSDISTDGRHANVQFTSDWNKDATRRDFTINAIYSDIQGRVFDPFNGKSDLLDGKIVFIGSAEERIQEDYLRILRYFRFFIQYSKNKHDEKIILSIKKHINGINKISNERIFEELKKILKLKNFHELFLNISSKEIILNIFPQFKYYERLKELKNLNQNLKNQYDKYLTLALIVLDESNNYDYFCHKYKVSSKIKNRFKNISDNFESLKNKKFYTKENIKKMIYFTNKDYVIDLLLFSICVNPKIKKINIEFLLNYIHSCKIPKFPISGDDLKKFGYETGELLGKKLKSLEQKWIENNFILDEKIIEKSVRKINKN